MYHIDYRCRISLYVSKQKYARKAFSNMTKITRCKEELMYTTETMATGQKLELQTCDSSTAQEPFAIHSTQRSGIC